MVVANPARGIGSIPAPLSTPKNGSYCRVVPFPLGNHSYKRRDLGNAGSAGADDLAANARKSGSNVRFEGSNPQAEHAQVLPDAAVMCVTRPPHRSRMPEHRDTTSVRR